MNLVNLGGFMKNHKGYVIIFLVLFLFTAITYAQDVKPRTRIGERPPERDMGKQRNDDLTRRENELHLLERRDLYDDSFDPERTRREEIVRCLKQLNENNEKLISLAAILDERRLKDAANLANKLANVSKDLRKNLDLKGKKEADSSLEVFLTNEEKIKEIQILATKLNDLILEVSKAQTIGSVDASQIDKTEENLQEIEAKARKMKVLASKK